MTETIHPAAPPQEEITALRLRILRNGYTPLPNLDKMCVLDRWPVVPVDAERIEHWGRRNRRFTATGLRVQDGLCVIDVDVDSPVAMRIVDAMEARVGAVSQSLLRYGRGDKVALFLRTDAPFGVIRTRVWTAPGGSLDDGTHRVEVFGGAHARQFGAFGWHTQGAISYEWDGDDPSTVPLADLPVITRDDVFALCDVAEDVLKDAGFEPVARTEAGEASSEPVYDIGDDAVFHMHDGRDMTLDELTAAAATETGLRCSASWLEGPGAVNTRRCLVSRDHNGNLNVWESGSGVSHRPAAAAPTPRDPADMQQKLRDLRDRIAPGDREAEDPFGRVRFRPPAGAGLNEAVAWLMESAAYCAHDGVGGGGGHIVPAMNGVQPVPMTVAAARNYMKPWAEVEVGPRGGERLVNPVDVWLGMEERVDVDGVVMRPGAGGPVIRDFDGRFVVNAYRDRPHKAQAGSLEMWHVFMNQLIPATDEREWFLNWLAAKWQRPQHPGVCVIMVAPRQGTGRGTLGDILRLLWHPAYVKDVSFDNFVGKGSQAVYNEWQADSVVCFVNEMHFAPDEGRTDTWAARKKISERLKEVVDPRPRVQRINRKYGRNSEEMCHASLIVASNNHDAIPIDRDDRRFAAVMNGQPASAAFWTELRSWMENPANVGALAEWLAARDVSAFNPNEVALETRARRMLKDNSLSDIDRGLRAALEEMTGDVFTTAQITRAMQRIKDRMADFEYPDRWQTVARKLIAREVYRVDSRDGTPRRVRGSEDGDKLHTCYARTPDAAEAYASIHAEHLRAALEENGPLGGDGMGKIVHLIRRKKKDGA